VPRTVPYGSWPSPITADLLVEEVVSLSQPVVSGEEVYWLEGRPSEAGRQVVVCGGPGREAVDVVPPGFSARTTVHEYGGGDYAVRSGTVFFSNFDDQHLYRVDPGGAPEPLTSEEGARYADADVSPDGDRLACVRERHLDSGEVVNDVVMLPTDGSAPPAAVAGGHDFFSAPRFSPDGSRLAWLSWDHPRMPWDGTELWIDGAPVAGGPTESVSSPGGVPTASCTGSPTAPAGGTSTQLPAGRLRPWRASSPAPTGSSASPPTPSCPTAAWWRPGPSGG